VRVLRNAFSSLRLLRTMSASPGGRLPFPAKLTFAVTGRCNLRCRMCGIWKDPVPEMPLAEVREFLARSPGFAWVDVTGGEILLRDDIGEILSLVVACNPRLELLHFPTNGFLPQRAEGVARTLARRRAVRLIVTVSIDGPPPLHDDLRGVAGSFERAVETFLRLRAVPGCEPIFGMTMGPDNAGTYQDTLSALRRAVGRLPVDDLHLNLFHRSPHAYRNTGGDPGERKTLLPAIEKALAHRPFSFRPRARLERRYLVLARRHLAEGGSSLPCRALAATCFVSPDGAVYPCIGWDRSLGRLADHGFSLSRLWDSPAAVEARREIASGRCPGCWTPCEAVPAMAARWRELLR
jgi:MoaA/NifB/PqqE/SkfB family radical SAM enzyme